MQPRDGGPAVDWAIDCLAAVQSIHGDQLWRWLWFWPVTAILDLLTCSAHRAGSSSVRTLGDRASLRARKRLLSEMQSTAI